jgi:hypothetical protein
MHREPAETFLRLLAEAELRRAATQPGDRAVVAGCASRVMQVAGALSAVRAFGEEVTGPVMDDFELALGTRRIPSPAGYGRGLRSWMGSAAPRGTPTLPDVAVPAGQVIPVHSEEVSGEVTLLSYAQTASGALLTLVARPGELRSVDPDGPWETVFNPHGGRPAVRRRGRVMVPYSQFTATDDHGASYQVSYHGNASRPGEWVLRLYPDPPRGLSWLDLNTTPGEPAARIDLTPAARPVVTVSPVTRSPGEQLLNNIAMRLLATGSVFPQFVLILLAEMALEYPGPLPGTADGLGDVIAALHAFGALAPRSPVPGQLAALCARLNVTGHGITEPPARDLPEPWLSVLTQHQRATARAAPARDGCAAVAATFPDLDGIRLAILGLTSSADGTMLHAHGSGLTHPYYGWPEKNLAPTIWIRDSHGGWHATSVDKQHEGDITMRLQVVPPLSPGTDRIEILLAGQSAEVRATLPLRWQ